MSESADFKEGLNFFLNKDYANAEISFQKAVDQGDPEAQFCLGAGPGGSVYVAQYRRPGP